MRLGRPLATLLFVGLGCGLYLGSARPAVAECSGFDRWPSFTEVARGAPTLLIGTVTAGFQKDGGGNMLAFRVRVDELLRGSAARSFEVQAGTRFRGRLACTNSMLRVHLGDVLAFALDRRASGSLDRVLTVAFVKGKVNHYLMPGVERLTAARVRAIAALPATDTASVAEPSAPDRGNAWPVLLLTGLLGGATVLLRLRDGRPLT